MSDHFDVEELRKGLHLSDYVLISEDFWVAAKEFLEQSGYRIHPKFDLVWTPTSSAEKVSALARMPRPSCVVDAIRMKDDVPVVIKKVEIREENIASHLAAIKDPRNHCVPIYEVLFFETWHLLVMPQLLRCDFPPFDTVGEVVECFRQLFEGIQFMHKHRTAHCDITLWNFMMTSDDMYPNGFSATSSNMRRDFTGTIKACFTRAQCWPRYYIIDFQRSAHFPSQYESDIAYLDEIDEERTPGQNPFPHDIHYLGQLMNRHFLNKHSYKRRHLEFLRPLVQDMLHETPSLRPTIDEVVLRFDTIVKSMPPSHMRHLVQPGGGHWTYDLFYPVRHAYLRIKHTLLLRSPIPKDVLPPIAVIPKDERDFFTQARYGNGEGGEAEEDRIRFRFRHYKDV